MGRALRYCFFGVCFAYAAVLTILFKLYALTFLAAFFLRRRGALDDSARLLNARLGAYLVRAFFPLIRVRRDGLDNMPDVGPVIVVANHRSFFDIFFCGLIPKPNMTVLVRSWPFRLPMLGRFMRIAGYIDVERLPFDHTQARVQALAARGVSSLCFPEGHRSPNGRLLGFGSGAFRLAVRNGLPVVPVCITGTEQVFGAGHRPIFRPARVRIEILPCVDPSSFPCDKRAIKLRRHVEAVFRKYLDE